MRLYFLLSALVLLAPVSAFSNHLYGGELQYTNISNLTYKVTLTLYGDCNTNNPTGFNELFTASPVVEVRLNAAQFNTMQLQVEGNIGEEITPVCPQQINNTGCSGGTLPGIRKFIYAGIITLPSAAHWTFAFTGNLGGPTAAGRSSNITNLVGGSQVFLEAFLDNTSGTNSSPQFTTIPTPFYCVGLQQSYNQGAIDPDNDSLGFSLVAALTATGVVNYASGYSGNEPLSTTAGTFSFNPVNGQMNFTPNLVQNSLVVNKVEEYQNGQLTGSSMREMSFIVLANCQNTPPSDTIDINSLTGGVIKDDVIYMCAGEPLLSFTSSMSDPDGDTLTISTIGLPAGATLNVTDNNTPAPFFNFSWNTTVVAPGVYTFFVNIKDRHCPLSSQQTRGYTIRITPKPVASFILPADMCTADTLDVVFTGSITPTGTYSWQWDNAHLLSGQGSGPYRLYWDIPGIKNITLKITDYFCEGDPFTGSIEVKSTPFASFDLDVACQYRPVEVRFTGNTIAGTQYNWSFTNGDPAQSASAGPLQVTWNTTGAQTITLITSNNGCVDSAVKEVTVNPKPAIILQNEPETVCVGQQIFLRYSGADSYTWLPKDKIFREPDGSLFVRVYEPVTYTVIAATNEGCNDTATLTYTDIRQCCTFSYPNAFTPNNDRHNDTWHPLMYGTHAYYELNIFNRWGQSVFHSFTPGEGWDGSYQGKPCNTDTYFYIFKAKCITGPEEEKKGEITLVR